MSGYFIVIEGGEGAGKSSAIEKIQAFFLSQGVFEDDIVLTREPGGTPMAEDIRALMLSPRDELVHAKTELLLAYASRCQHFYNKIQPALQVGKVVICDRYSPSSFAYQIRGQGADPRDMNLVHELVLGGAEPNQIIYLDIDPRVGMQRVVDRGEVKDRMEQKTLDFFNNVRNGYLEYMAMHSSIADVIDAGQSIEQVHADLEVCLKKRYVCAKAA